MRHKVDFLRDDIFKLFIRYLIPSVLATLTVSIYIFVDTIFIGRGLGSEGLAALNIAIPIYSVLLSIGLLFGVGGATAMSVSAGKGNSDKVNHIFTHSTVIAFLIGLLITVFGIIFIDKFSYFLGADENTFPLVKEYLIVIIAFSLSFILVSNLTVFIRNDRAPKLAMWGTAVGSITNIILDAISGCRGIGLVLLGVMVLPYFFSIDGVWLTVPLAEVLTMILSGLFLVTLKALKEEKVS